MSNKKLGRPRDENIRKKILKTTIMLLIENGYPETTMKDIAVKASVSKQTLYRWWNNRAELLMEAFLYYAEENILFPETESSSEGLFEFLCNTFVNSSTTDGIRILLKALLAESIKDEIFAKVFFTKFIAQRQNFLAKKLAKMHEFESQNESDINAMVDLIFGAMWYRLIFSHRPLDDNFAKEIVMIILKNY